MPFAFTRIAPAVRLFTARILTAALLVSVAPSASAQQVHRDWANAYQAPDHLIDRGHHVAVAPSGNIYVAAESYNHFTHNYDLFVLKLRPDGTVIWHKILDAKVNNEEVTGLDVDSRNCPVVSAGTRDESNTPRLSLWKFDADTGDVLWDRHHPEAGDCLRWDPAIAALAVDGDDNVVVAGCGMNVYKYATDGALAWQRSGVPAALDAASDIAVASDGSIRVAGVRVSDYDRFGVVAYDADGTLEWSDDRAGPIGSIFDRARIAIGPAGETVVAGDVESTCGVGALRLVRFTSGGVFDWEVDYPPIPCDNYTPAGVAIDSTGRIVIAATRFGFYNIAATQFDTNGAMTWEQLYDGPGGSTDTAADVALDADDNVYILGEEWVASQDRDFVVRKYTADGAFVWTNSYPAPGCANDRPYDLAVDACGRVYATGYGYNPSSNSDVLVLRLTQIHPGDLNADGDVDLADFQIIQQSFALAFGAEPKDGDLDDDGDVDADDVTLFVAAQTSPCR